ncbi:MAG: PAS domain S-box protein [Bacteroidetes bacterium]|nr:PAS domain S-box protein [Bacteroidota bacterium]
MEINSDSKQQLLDEITKLNKRILELEKTEEEAKNLLQSGNKAIEALQFISTKLSAFTGVEFFNKVCGHLTNTLAIDYAFVGKIHSNQKKVNVIAGVGKGNLLESFEYSLDDTPCMNLLNNSVCCYPTNIQKLFPKDKLLIEMGIDGYLGVPLFNKTGGVVGIMVLLHSQPILNAEVSESLLQIFSERVAAEIERIQVESKLMESEELFSDFFQISTNILTISSLEDGRILELNEIAAQSIGLPKNEIINRKFTDIGLIDDKSREIITDAIVKKGYYKALELPVKIASGEIRTGLFYGHIITLNNQKCLFQTIIDITVRKEEQEILNKLNLAVRNSTDVIFMTDKDGIFTFVNKQFTELYGFTAIEVVNIKTPRILKSDLFTEEEYKYFWETILNKESLKTQYLNRCKNGKFINVEASADPILNNNGDIIGFLAIQRDITDAKKAEEDLKESEQKLRLVINNSPIGICTTDLKGHFIDVNPALCKILGYSKNKITGKHFNQFSHPDDVSKNDELFNKLVVGEISFTNFEKRYIHKNGNIIHVNIRGQIINDSKGKPILQNGIVENITERKHAEEAIKQRESLLKAILNSTGNGFLVVDNNGTVTHRNKKFNKLWNIPSKLSKSRDDSKLLDFVLGQLSQPDQFISKVKELYLSTKTDTDILHFKDGRVFERNSHPLIMDNNIAGRVWGFKDITKGKQAEKVSKENEEKLRNIFENSTNIFYSHNTEHQHTYISRQVEDILGYTQEEALVKWTDWLSDNPINEFGLEKTLEAIRIGERQLPYELELIHKSGDKVWVEVREFPLVKNGETTAIVGSVTEITKRKKAELIQKTLFNISNAVITIDNLQNLLKCIQIELGEIINTANFYVAFYDAKTDLISLPFFTNEKVNSISVITGKTLTRHVINTKKSLLINKEKLIKLRKSNQIRDFEIDPEIWLGVPLKFENELIGVLAVQSYTNKNEFNESDLKLLEFVSDQISISIHRKKAEEIIKESEARFKNLSSVTVEGIIMHKNGKIIDLNLSAAKMVGYEYEELIGGNIIELLADKVYHEIILENSKKKHSLPYEILGIKKDGSRFPVEIEGRTISFENGEEVRVVAIRDITERKTTEKELIKALEKATESDRLKSAFLATMSHELRTPLNAIIGFSEFLNKDLSMEDVEKFGEIINNSGNHLLSIVNDLFEITLIESGETKIRVEEVNLKNIFYDILNIITSEQQKANKNDIKLNLIIPPGKEDFTIKTDPNKLKQILLNLLKNAIKFTDTGHVNYGFEILSEQENLILKFYVEDTGIGIPKEKHNLIFDVFRQAEESNSRRYGGVGIGLSVASRLTELLGGEIWLESEVGKGSTFYFTLPVDRKAKIIQIPEIQVKRINKDKKMILIVEDDKVSFEFIKIVLIRSEIDCIWAKNGAEAITFCEENDDISLVLMDINMPVMDGYTATQKIKKFKPNLPIIAQTAYAISGDREKAFEMGCDDYISKPINQKALLEKIKTLLK